MATSRFAVPGIVSFSAIIIFGTLLFLSSKKHLTKKSEDTAPSVGGDVKTDFRQTTPSPSLVERFTSIPSDTILPYLKEVDKNPSFHPSQHKGDQDTNFPSIAITYDYKSQSPTYEYIAVDAHQSIYPSSTRIATKADVKFYVLGDIPYNRKGKG
jgi:hypothetical protein